MTFCLGMIVQEGIVGIADSRLTSGHEIIRAKKCCQRLILPYKGEGTTRNEETEPQPNSYR
jgi:predicted proteasome-type protease